MLHPPAIAFASVLALAIGCGAQEAPDFQRDVLPILSNHCFPCHGPDAATRKKDLRLDVRESAIAIRGWRLPAVMPGQPESSDAVVRARATDKIRMPPEDAGPALTEAQVGVLERWIAAGAVYEQHWSFVAPERPELPAVGDPGWARNPIDRFVLAALEARGLTPRPEAAPHTLQRRAALDLTGLPPSAEALDAVGVDAGFELEAYLDELFASPRHGEHLARHWLDLSRYGDTHGFHLDNVRALWPWRDWVIAAFQDNMPFDQFTIEQLAGDLLPEPTRDQLVATGFNRCNPTTGEGGLIEAEYLARYAKDRVETVSTVWMGLTVGCANCHDHKFDPVSQEEFYSLYAFFNSFDEEGTDRNALVPPPNLAVPTPEQAAEQTGLDEEIAALDRRLAGPLPEVDAGQRAWETEAAAAIPRWMPLQVRSVQSEGGATLEALDDGTVRATGAQPAADAYVVVGALPATRGLRALRLRVLPDEGLVGRASHGNIVLSQVRAEVARLASPESDQPLEWTPLVWGDATADHNQAGYDVDGVLDDDTTTGWALGGAVDRPHQAVLALAEPLEPLGPVLLRVRLEFASAHPDHALRRFGIDAIDDASVEPATWGEWSHLGPIAPGAGGEGQAPPLAGAHAAALAPERQAAAGGVDLSRAVLGQSWRPQPGFRDRAVHALPSGTGISYLRRTVASPGPRAVRLGFGSDDSLKVWLNGELILDRDVRRPVALDQDAVTAMLRAGGNELLVKVVDFGGGHGFAFRLQGEEVQGVPVDVGDALARAADERTEAQRRAVRSHYRRTQSAEFRALEAERAALVSARTQLEASFPQTMIVRARKEPRPANIMIRGRYDLLGAPVARGVPAFLPPLREGQGVDRLALARWLVSGEHPLTARVAANRIWQWVFGQGLVRTPEDFGVQGEPPTHPELLDWLACELVDSGWDTRHVLRLIMTSATWRQSARVTAEALSLDPDNRLLSRSPRVRLDAEVIRDSALAVAGLLVEHVGGESVKPYQPSGIWKAVGYTSSNTANFVQDEGDKLWRRSLYTFWKRTAPPPTLALFDAPTRESCVAMRSRTNTPLQALALLNDVQFVEAARHFAARIHGAAGDDDAKMQRAFVAATARTPTARELAVLRGLLDDQRAMFADAPDRGRALLSVGDSPPTPGDAAELAAWTMVAQTLLNLDEVVTRP